MEAAGDKSEFSALGQSPVRTVLLCLGAMVFSVAIAAVATIGAGPSFIGESVVVLDQPGVSYSPDLGSAQAELMATLAPTIAERAKSDDVLSDVAQAISYDGDLTALRNRVSAVVLPDTIAIRLRVEFSSEDVAQRAIEILTTSFTQDVAQLQKSDAPPIVAELIRAPVTADNRPSTLRSIVIAGFVGLLLGAVAAAILERG